MAALKPFTTGASLIYDIDEVKRFSELILCEQSSYHLRLVERIKYKKERGLTDVNERTVRGGKLVDGIQRLIVLTDDVDALVVFCALHPSNIRKALIGIQRRCFDLISEGRETPPLLIALSEHHKAIDRATFIHLDVDTKDASRLDGFLFENDIKVAFKIQTRGGFHYLIRRSDGNRNFASINNLVLEQFDTTVCPEPSLIPVPGTLQGGFRVRFV